MTALYVLAKLNARALLDQVFPTFEGVFHDLYSETAQRVLECCLQEQGDRIRKTIEETAGRSHAQSWVEEKVWRVEEALREWHRTNVSSSQVCILEGMLSLLRSFQEQLKRLEKQMQELSRGMPEVELLRTIPGIGEKLAATLVAELGDIRQFESPKQLVAYAGLDPGVFSSGKFTASSNRITKRGSKRLRRALYLTVHCGLRRGNCSKLRPYYDKKKKEGKPYKVAVIACANKLLHHIYAILRKGQPYQP
uniref:IS110 family transposase n=1 Tax=Paenibacillus durus TaxID=44251 RepID=UPI0004BB16E2|nr:IS110 family transposase [Paenibacillus durus]